MKTLACMVLLAAAAGCGKSAASGPSLARTKSFSITIPAGWQVESGDGTDVLTLVQQQRTADGYFVGSLVFGTTEAPTRGGVGTEAECTSGAQQAARGTKRALEGSQLLDTAAGKACEIRLGKGDDKQAGVMTMVIPPASYQQMWTFTCNHDYRDQEVVAACRSAITSMKLL